MTDTSDSRHPAEVSLSSKPDEPFSQGVRAKVGHVRRLLLCCCRGDEDRMEAVFKAEEDGVRGIAT